MAELQDQPAAIEDPELRAALKRVSSGDGASTVLRDRIASMLANPPTVAAGDAGAAASSDVAGDVAGRITPQSAAAHAAARSPRKSRVWKLAVAACVLLAVGGGLHFWNEHQEDLERREYAEKNEPVLAAMVTMHGEPIAVTGADHFTQLADAKALADAMSKRLGRQVPTPDLSKDGWKLTDAAVCSFQSQPAARFEFAKADRHVTVMSVPEKLFKEVDDDDTYNTTLDGHAISGYVQHDGVHCIVGDSGVPLDEVTTLRKHLQHS